MSAWLCRNKTLSLVVDVVKSDEFKEFDTGEYSNKEKIDILNVLSELNTESLNARYGKSVDNILEDKEYIRLDVEDGQKYKSVCCYLYQTCESEDNYEHPLFVSLVAWRDCNSDDFESVSGKYYWDVDEFY